MLGEAVAPGFFVDAAADEGGEGRVVRARAQGGAEVDLVLVEKAEPERAVRGEAHAIAFRTEGH